MPSLSLGGFKYSVFYGVGGSRHFEFCLFSTMAARTRAGRELHVVKFPSNLLYLLPYSLLQHHPDSQSGVINLPPLSFHNSTFCRAHSIPPSWNRNICAWLSLIPKSHFWALPGYIEVFLRPCYGLISFFIECGFYIWLGWSYGGRRLYSFTTTNHHHQNTRGPLSLA